MKFTAVIALLLMFVGTEAQAQRRPYPYPTPRPRPMPMPPRRPPPPMPRPRPVPPMFACRGADLIQHNWVIHRFRWTNDCHMAVQDLYNRGRFCDEGSLYDGRGNFIRQYESQFACRSWLK